MPEQNVEPDNPSRDPSQLDRRTALRFSLLSFGLATSAIGTLVGYGGRQYLKSESERSADRAVNYFKTLCSAHVHIKELSTTTSAFEGYLSKQLISANFGDAHVKTLSRVLSDIARRDRAAIASFSPDDMRSLVDSLSQLSGLLGAKIELSGTLSAETGDSLLTYLDQQARRLPIEGSLEERIIEIEDILANVDLYLIDSPEELRPSGRRTSVYLPSRLRNIKQGCRASLVEAPTQQGELSAGLEMRMLRLLKKTEPEGMSISSVITAH